MKSMLKTAIALSMALLSSLPARADDAGKYEITIKNLAFDKSEVKISANKPALLVVNNQDDKDLEFESHEIDLEKVVSAHSTRIIYLRMLKSGSYPFKIDHHDDTGHGMLIVE